MREVYSLEASQNPFAVVVMAHLYTKQTKHKPNERFELKWRLTRMLYERGYSKQDVLSLFRFIDWMMALPPELEQQLEGKMIAYEEEQKVPYITSIERIGIQKGLKQLRWWPIDVSGGFASQARWWGSSSKAGSRAVCQRISSGLADK